MCIGVTLDVNDDVCATGVHIGRPQSMIGVGRGGCISISVLAGVSDVGGT